MLRRKGGGEVRSQGNPGFLVVVDFGVSARLRALSGERGGRLVLVLRACGTGDDLKTQRTGRHRGEAVR